MDDLTFPRVKTNLPAFILILSPLIVITGNVSLLQQAILLPVIWIPCFARFLFPRRIFHSSLSPSSFPSADKNALSFQIKKKKSSLTVPLFRNLPSLSQGIVCLEFTLVQILLYLGSGSLGDSDTEICIQGMCLGCSGNKSGTGMNRTGLSERRVVIKMQQWHCLILGNSRVGMTF